MKNLHTLAAWMVVPLAIWCVWLQLQVNSLVARTKESSDNQKQVRSDLRDLELALGLVRERKMERDGLSRLSFIESRIQVIENELASQPIGTLIQVVQPQTQTIGDNDPIPAKVRKDQINAYVRTLMRESEEALEQFYWRPAEDSHQASAREYPEASGVYVGLPNDTADFTLNPRSQRTFVRLKKFKPAADGMFDVGVFRTPQLTPVRGVRTEPTPEASPPK